MSLPSRDGKDPEIFIKEEDDDKFETIRRSSRKVIPRKAKDQAKLNILIQNTNAEEAELEDLNSEDERTTKKRIRLRSRRDSESSNSRGGWEPGVLQLPGRDHPFRKKPRREEPDSQNTRDTKISAGEREKVGSLSRRASGSGTPGSRASTPEIRDKDAAIRHGNASPTTDSKKGAESLRL
jgi:hypothetical protein